MTGLLALMLAAPAALVCVQSPTQNSPGQANSAADSPYARWTHGPPTDPDWFPIGVWLQEPSLAARYRALGVNTFVGLWKGPTEEQLATLRAEGMKVVCGANAVGMKHRADRNIIAWMQTDEPENKASGRSGPRATVQESRASYRRLGQRDPTRPVWMNLGQGVANDSWRGMGAPRSDYPAYVSTCDIVSFDVYPVTNIRRSDGQNYLWYVAKGVRRLRAWGNNEKIVWNVIETTRGPQESLKPTPAQMRAEVWLSLVAGSRGIVYFCHEFEPRVSAAALLLDTKMCAAIKELNAEILALAPILNSPTLTGRAMVVDSSPGVPIATMVKEYEGALYLFAIAARNGSARATFSIEGAGASSDLSTVEVLGENRHRPLDGNRFQDSFSPYAFHLYRIDANEGE